MVLETSVLYRHLTRLIAREDFIEFSCHESPISQEYVMCVIYMDLCLECKRLVAVRLSRRTLPHGITSMVKRVVDSHTIKNLS
jgi:hypothetical protein